jgi:hypothetical protein
MSDYNWEMTGAPDPSVAWTDPEAAASYNNFVAQQNAASGGAGQQLPSIDNSGNFVAPPAPTEPPIWLRPESYTSEGFAAPYTQEQANTTVDPNNIRQGYGGAYYSGLQGNTSYFDPTSAGEYLVDPNTKKFLKDASGNLIAVPKPNPNVGKFGDFMGDVFVPGLIAAMAAGTGLGAAGLIGEGAALGAGGLDAGTFSGSAFQLPETAGYLGEFVGPLVSEGGIDVAAADAAAQAAAAAGGAGLSASTLASLASALKAGGSLSSLFGGKSTGGTNTGSALPNLLRQATGGYAQSAPGGLYKGNVNPFTFAKEQPIQNKTTTSYDPFAALNVAQTPVNYSPNAVADILRKYEG